MKLVIVESPTKSKTISKFLTLDYKVVSSFGHVRDLPEKEFGVEIENDFKPKYVIPKKAKKTVQFLKKEAKKAKMVILALDEDREGESIGWHLIQILGLNGKKPYQRIVFHEITKDAILEALKNPRKINLSLVNAQQARRILDRIVGYKLSPFLWKKVAKRLSAGRVQSVAVRLVCDREKEIENFVSQEYWTVEACLLQEVSQGEFLAQLIKKEGKVLPKLAIKSKKEVDKILKDLEGTEYKVKNVEKKQTKKNPPPPFITSTLQQEAWKKFHWPAKFTMSIAQELYEKGFTTYHRTDSLNLAKQALETAKNFIIENYGKEYFPGSFRKFKTKVKGAQEAHEAIRPTDSENTPEKLKIKAKLKETEFKLYNLIWRRFIACQMSQAVFDSVKVDIEAKNYLFRASGQILKFDGFLKVYPIKYEEKELPDLKVGEILKLKKLIPTQHFTQPPPRYTEASLIKVLEEYGIGRPSTYAPILSTIQERNYIKKNEEKKFLPTELGRVVNELLVNHFSKIVDVKFTAEMEENLDKIAKGEEKWVKILREFYDPFEENLQKKYREISKKEITEKETEFNCPKCHSKLLIKLGRFGKFLACSNFPKCKYTESLEKNNLPIKCPQCKVGQIIEKKTKKQKTFYGCSQYPKCDFALWERPTGKICPQCQSLIVENKKKQLICSNKKCNHQE
jgi:DNA topoisomerase-1